jgi:hypothetical protein
VSKLPSQPGLPDPLVMFDGERVADKEQWITKRRPELQMWEWDKRWREVAGSDIEREKF